MRINACSKELVQPFPWRHQRKYEVGKHVYKIRVLLRMSWWNWIAFHVPSLIITSFPCSCGLQSSPRHKLHWKWVLELCWCVTGFLTSSFIVIFFPLSLGSWIRIKAYELRLHHERQTNRSVFIILLWSFYICRTLRLSQGAILSHPPHP